MVRGILVMAMAAVAAAQGHALARSLCAYWEDGGQEKEADGNLDDSLTPTMLLLLATIGVNWMTTMTGVADCVAVPGSLWNARRVAREAAAKGAERPPPPVTNYFSGCLDTGARKIVFVTGLVTTGHQEALNRDADEGNLSIWADVPPYAANR